MKDAQGAWHKIDPTLARGKDGRLRPLWAVGDLSLSAGGDTIVATYTHEGETTTWSWPSVLPAPSVVGNVATYKLNDAENLVVTASGTGLTEDIVLMKRPVGPKSVVLPMKAKGSSISRKADGTLQLTNGKGKGVLFAEKPFAYDSSKNVGGDPQVGAIETTVTGDGAGLSMTPDWKFLSDPKTVYPVTIDPSFSGNPSGDTWVQTPDYPSSQYTSTELKAGTYDGGAHVARSYLAFPQTNFDGKHVLSATLTVWNYYSGSCTGSPILARQVTQNWVQGLVTWANQPAVTTANQSSYSPAHGYSSACGAASSIWDITGIAQSWANGAVHYGLQLIAQDERSVYSWRRYYSVDYASQPGRPYITVTYNSTPSSSGSPDIAPLSSYTPPGGNPTDYTSSRQPTISAPVSDPDGGSVRAAFYYYTSQAGSPVASCTSGYVPSGSRASCVAPTSLADGVYYLRAQEFDGTDYGPMSPWAVVTVAAGTPAAPVVGCPGYADGTWTDTAPAADLDCTITATGSGPSAPGRISYSVDGGATNVVTIRQSTDPNVAVIHVSVSRANGAHAITATALNPAGVASSAANARFGYGPLTLNSPGASPLVRTMDKVTINASGPATASSSQSLSAVVKWRVAGGAETDPWTTETPTLSVTGSSGSSVTVTGTWNSTAALKAANVETRVPQLLDVQVCVNYSPASTQCSWSSGHSRVLHLAHAFGAGFPTTDVENGQVALWTGEFATSSTDATLNAGPSALSVGRTASTFAGASGNPASSVFGPGWTADLTGDPMGHADAEVVDSTRDQGLIAVTDSDGSTLLFSPTDALARRTAASLAEGAWVPFDEETAQSGIKAEVYANAVTLTDTDGTKTTFTAITAPTASTAAVFGPGSVTQPGSGTATTFAYDTSKRVTRILAPVPAGMTCAGVMNIGCRTLDLTYAAATTATASVPGDFAGQVQRISANIAGSLTVLSSYKYDSSGRLVAVKDERTGLVTTYAYDAASTRIATITSPGLTPVNYVYNTVEQLKQVTRVRPSTAPAGTANLTTIVYDVPASGTGATSIGLPDLTSATVAAWMQPTAPGSGVAVFGADHPLPAATTAANLTSADGPFASMYYTDAKGYTLNTGVYGAGRWLLTATEYDKLDHPTRELSTGDIAAIQDGLLAAVDAGTLTVYNTQKTDAVGKEVLPAGSVVTDVFATARDVSLADGRVLRLRPHTHTDYDQDAPNAGINPATGQQYALPTTVTSGVTDLAGVDVRAGASAPADLEVTSILKTGYANAVPGGDANAGWDKSLASSTSTVMDNSVAGGTAGAAAITKTTAYNTLGQPISTRQPMSTGADAGTRTSVYYQAGTGSGVAACDNKPAWQGLLCQTGYVGNPAGGPGMITATSTYNDMQQPLTLTEVSGSSTRTTTTGYDAAGRPSSTKVVVTGLTGSVPVPEVTTGYDPATGLARSTSTAGGVNGGTITTGYDTWGRVASYATSTGTSTTTYDAAGNKATTTGADGTVTTFTYDGTGPGGKAEHRGVLTRVAATGNGTATSVDAVYAPNGGVASQSFGGGLSQVNTFDTAGNPVGRTYRGDVTENGVVTPDSPWIGWSQRFDAAGRVVAEWTPDAAASTGVTAGAPAGGSSRTYVYDPASRLVGVTDRTTPAGAGGVAAGGMVSGGVCVIRRYSFDAHGNRVSKTTTPANADGSCQSGGSPSGVVTTSWSHDAADRITNAGYVYDNLGRTISVPQADTPVAAAGRAPGGLGLSYFDTDQIQAQTQAGVTVTNALDAVGRPLTQASGPTGGAVASTTTLGYVHGSDSPGFETTDRGGVLTSEAYVSGPDGLLAVTLTSAHTAQVGIGDLRGSVVAQVTLPTSGAAAGLDDWSVSDEYGNPVDVTTPAGVTASNPTGDPTGGLGYGWEGSHQRATTGMGLIQMGARLYNPVTGAFTSPDPVYGGNTTTYAYPQDPINMSDLNGEWGIPKWAKRAAKWVSDNRHKIVNVAVSVAAAAGTAACVASVACGGGLFLVGAASVFVAGAGANQIVATPAERKKGGGQWFAPTARSEAKGIVCGFLLGRGCVGAVARGTTPKGLLHGVPARGWLGKLRGLLP